MRALAPAELWGEAPFYLPEDWRAEELSWISHVISDEIERQWPPFVQGWYGDRYRELAMDADWFAQSFLANAEKEAAGARSLWRIAAEAHDHPFASEVADHARDEARHARMYLGMLELTLPGALEPEASAALQQLFPVFQSGCPAAAEKRPIIALLDDIVQMNIGEIRTRLHQQLLRPVALAVAPSENRQRLSLSLTRIYEDEGRHIIYTARILERYAAAGYSEQIADLYTRRLHDFAALTLREVGVGSFD